MFVLVLLYTPGRVAFQTVFQNGLLGPEKAEFFKKLFVNINGEV